MPGSTPVYGFPYPDPSDLVANYPALGQDLAEDIEAVLPTLGGFTKIAAGTLSAATTVSINNCFSATYENYMITVALTNAANTGNVNMRLRVGGTDNSTGSNYAYGMSYIDATSAGFNAGSTGANEFKVGEIGNTLDAAWQTFTYMPAITQFTHITGQAVRWNGSNIVVNPYGGVHKQNTAYDGFTIFASFNLTGTVTVYGLSK